MKPEQVAALVRSWVRLYTRDLPPPLAERRAEEIDADVSDHIAHARTTGVSHHRIAIGILSRMVRGITADLRWRNEHNHATSDAGPPQGESMTTPSYRIAAALALGAALFLAWGVAAMGIIGAEGDPFDRLYFAVVAIGILGALLARLRPAGMARAMWATALAQALVAVLALMLGKQDVPVSSVAEIVGLNGFFIALFVAAAWLFSRASVPRGSARDKTQGRGQPDAMSG